MAVQDSFFQAVVTASTPPDSRFAHLACGVIVRDRHGRIIEANAAAEHILGVSLPTAPRAAHEKWWHTPNALATLWPDHDPSLIALRTGRPQRAAIVSLTRADGERRWLHIDAIPILDEYGRVEQVVTSFIDVTAFHDEGARHAYTHSVHAQGQHDDVLLRYTGDLISIVDGEGQLRYASPSYRAALDYDPEDLVGRSVLEFVHPDDRPLVIRYVKASRDDDARDPLECRVQHADGSWRTLEVRTFDGRDNPAIRGYIVNGRDITDHIRAAEMLRHQALHDALTGLPNRVLFNDRLEQALSSAKRPPAGSPTPAPLALLLIDLDRFKEVNDTLGHHYGDLLLQQVATRLRAVLRISDTVARLGGDEFAILLPGDEIDGATQAAHKLLTALDTPIIVEGQSLHVGASIGIAIYPQDGADAQTLLRHADIAMYAAKHSQSSVAPYDAARDHHTPRRFTLLGALREAIARDDLLLHYQPKIDITTGKVTCVEALARWRFSRQRMLSPDQFIPLAEQSGLIGPLTLSVLKIAIRQCREWREQGLEMTVAVNFSAANLRDQQLSDTIANLLQSYELPPDALRVELTESTVMVDSTYTSLKYLEALGVGISIDDFGTGYSSLAYLKRLPVDELKIDKSFVMDLATDDTDLAIVSATINLGHSLGVRVVAEGVENRRSWNLLSSLGCDAAQGYFVSRPLPAADLARWLTTASTTHA